MEETNIRGIVKYQCGQCDRIYDQRKEAEDCAAPQEPRFNLGEWVQATELVCKAALGGDSFSHGYDYIERGMIGRISRISDENKIWGKKKPHPDFVYSFDKGDFPMTLYCLQESVLQKIDTTALEKNLSRS